MKLLITNCFILFSFLGLSNNIVVSNVGIGSQNTAQDFSMVNFDLSWDNSWRVAGGPMNWDAAWVFVKYRLKSQSTWNHAKLNWVDGTGANDGHTVPASATIASAKDNTADTTSNGVFIYHNTNMAQGTVNYTNIALRWDYGKNGLVDSDSVEVCVFAIEMVYVPQGSFYLGGLSTTYSSGGFYQYPYYATPYQITSEATVGISTVSGYLHYGYGTYVGDHGGPIYAGFPKGFNAFYCMKYEISQQQYVDFLNKLTPTQDASRYFATTANRHSIGGVAGNRTTNNPNVACNYLSKEDLNAYLDWAALRPMTEFEYEKACRGPQLPFTDEYAWGNAQIASTNYTLVNPSLPNENIATNYSTISGNAVWNSTQVTTLPGPLRCGIFAANGSNSGRVSAGASYYGIMELTGNLFETVISVGQNNGRAYQGRNGDGVLNSIGASVGPEAVVNSNAWGLRGGSFTGSIGYCRVSDRTYGWNPQSLTYRVLNIGGRGVRLAP